MARGRHARRGLLSRLGLLCWRGLSSCRWPVLGARASQPVADAARLAALEGEVSRLRVLGIAHAAAAASADVRARRAEEQLTLVHAELALLREDLVWAFAEGRLPVAVPVAVPVAGPVAGPVALVDLRDDARTA